MGRVIVVGLWIGFLLVACPILFLLVGTITFLASLGKALGEK